MYCHIPCGVFMLTNNGLQCSGTLENPHTPFFRFLEDSPSSPPQGGGGTLIPNQGLVGGWPAEGRKKNNDLTNLMGGADLVIDMREGTLDGFTGPQ